MEMHRSVYLKNEGRTLALSPDGFIGVFDSGAGGISVLREMVRLMPSEDFIYFGDSANAPYGTKSEEEIRRLTVNHVESLLSEGAKGICVACNTATSAAVRVMRGMFPELPLVGIEPAVKPAVLSMDNPKVLVLATPATVRQEKLHALIDRFKDRADIIPVGCPGLMEFVERGETSGADLDAFLRELLGEYIDAGIDCIVLGCTHYPFVRDALARVFGGGVRIFDGGEGAARQMKRLLGEAGLLKDEGGTAGRVVFRSSDTDPGKLRIFERLMTVIL